MNSEAHKKFADFGATQKNGASLPQYETPKIQAMSEQDILKSFQITQSMGTWWTTPTC